MAEDKSQGLQEADVRRIVQDEVMAQAEAPYQAGPVADPAPMGLAGFALTTFLFSIINAGWLEQIGTFIPLAFVYGGIAQFVAGLWEFRNNNTFGAVIFTSYGAFWGGVGFFFFSAGSLGVLADIGASLGFTLVAWTVFTLYVWIASLKVNKAIFVMFAVFILTLILLDLGFGLALPGVIVIGGYVGILLALCAWYISAAGLINHAFGRVVLPLGTPFGAANPQPAPPPPERATIQPLPEEPTQPVAPPAPPPEPPTQTPPEPNAEQLSPEATPQEGITTPPATKWPQDTDEIVSRPTEETEGHTPDTQSPVRESAGESHVADAEAVQPAGPPVVPETQADAKELPITDYNSLSAGQVTQRLSGLSIEELKQLRDYEAEHQNRLYVIERFEQRIQIIRDAGPT